MPSTLLSLLLVATACAASPPVTRDTCKPCNPQGATGSNPPPVGQELKSLYIDLLESVKDIHFKRRWADPIVERADSFCCKETLDCVKVNSLNIPMCYDKFTTQYAFPDGSYGSLTTGDYNSKDGSKANLVSGDYTKAGGEQGNVYAQDPGAKPNTATLSIPPQWTAEGEGTPIPATEIAGTLTVSTTTPAAVTSAATTSVINSADPGATTAQNAAAPSSSSVGGAAGFNSVDTTRSLSMSLISALVWAFYAF